MHNSLQPKKVKVLIDWFEEENFLREVELQMLPVETISDKIRDHQITNDFLLILLVVCMKESSLEDLFDQYWLVKVYD